MQITNKKIIIRFATVWFLLLLVMAFIITNVLKIQTTERNNWLKLTKSYSKKDILVRANRGNIYSDNYELMATSVPLYYIYMDTQTESLLQKGGKLFYENIDSLSYCLSHYFKDKSKATYKKELLNAFRKRNRGYKLYKNKITFSQLKDIKQFPLFRLGRFKSGLFTKEMFMRVKPYTTLASRTIGDIYKDKDMGGKNGLELGFESMLRGTPGVASRQKIANRWQSVVEVEPIDGMDIVSTINVEIQDIAEKALLDKLSEINATAGYAVVMEVKTAEIKAIVNMSKRRDGRYAERRNGVVADESEPGSTFKVASLMALLDEGKATLNDTIDTGNGIYNYGKRSMEDHNYNRGGYGRLALENALNASSNIGISRAVVKAYGNNPAEFVDKLYKIGLNEPFQLYIPGTGKPNIPHPKDTAIYWSSIHLPWMSIGYNVDIPPIYTLAFFNAIANDGKFLEPLLVKRIQQNGKVIKRFKARVIRKKICKPTTLEDVKKAMLGVVEHPKYATATKVRSDLVRIAGKTATAQISRGKKGYSGHQVAFCGFFPFENPQYSCIVVIREPKKGNPSGGKMAGPVFKNIAERIVAINIPTTIQKASDSILIAQKPILKSGNSDALYYVLDDLNEPFKDSIAKNRQSWIRVRRRNNLYSVRPIDIKRNLIPNFLGMGAKDAIYLCETLGLRVNVRGVGRVYSQSIKAGKKIVKGKKIELVLKSKR